MQNRLRSFLFRCAVAFAALSCMAFAPHYAYAQAWDPVKDFSAVNNPNGVWQYGYSSTLTSPFQLFTEQVSMGGGVYNEWHQLGGPEFFSIGLATTDFNRNGVNIPANVIRLHPNQDNSDAKLLFTAPTSGLYDIDATFSTLDPRWPGNTMDVHVLVNDTSVFDSLLVNAGPSSSFSSSSPFSLSSGDTIAFAVGTGGNYVGDTVGLVGSIFQPTVAAVPEASTLILLLSTGLTGTGLLMHCRQRGRC